MSISQILTSIMRLMNGEGNIKNQECIIEYSDIKKDQIELDNSREELNKIYGMDFPI